MKNKIHLELRKAELEWVMTFPDCPEQDCLEMKQELREIEKHSRMGRFHYISFNILYVIQQPPGNAE